MSRRSAGRLRRVRSHVVLHAVGSNNILSTIGASNADVFGMTSAVNVRDYTYSLAEGATGSFFDTELTLAIPARRRMPC